VNYPVPDLVLKAEAGAEVGDVGRLKVTVRSKELGPLRAQTSVTVARVVDLAAIPAQMKEPVAPGEIVDHRLSVRNNGPEESTRGVALRFTKDNRLELAAHYRHCVYAASTIDDGYERVWCTFPAKIPVGATYQLSAPMFKVSPDAPPKTPLNFDFTFTTADQARQNPDWFFGRKPVAGTGDVLRLVPGPGQPSAGKEPRAKVIETYVGSFNGLGGGVVETPAVPPTSVSASASPTLAAGDGGGSLPITGSNTMLVAGGGWRCWRPAPASSWRPADGAPLSPLDLKPTSSEAGLI
jgi:hypothetical protein